MKILALETTDLAGSVAASDGTNLLLELELNPEQRSAQSLAPAIKTLLDQIGWHPTDIELVAVTVGPGSFTGLRVGVTTAKTFAYAANADILAVDTLETIAANLGGMGEEGWERTRQRTEEPISMPVQQDLSKTARISAETTIEVVLDAQRGEIVVGTFFHADDGWYRPTMPQCIVPIDRWLADLRPGVIVAGPILRKLQSRIPHDVVVAGEPLWHPHAAQVARLAARDFTAGRRDDLWSLLPRYSRRSAAEEKLEHTTKEAHG